MKHIAVPVRERVDHDSGVLSVSQVHGLALFVELELQLLVVGVEDAVRASSHDRGLGGKDRRALSVPVAILQAIVLEVHVIRGVQLDPVFAAVLARSHLVDEQRTTLGFAHLHTRPDLDRQVCPAAHAVRYA